MTAENDTQRIARLTPIEEVLSRIDALVKPVAPCERDPAAAAGLALARDILAERRPAAALALRDGWAVRSELAADAGSYAPAPLPGAAWVDAGAPLPSGADAVASPDAVSVRGGRTEALAPIAPGEGVLPAGTDCDPQQPLLRQGRRLDPLAAGILEAAGVTRVAVREPQIGLVLATGKPTPVLAAIRASMARMIAADGAALSVGIDGDFDAVLADARHDAVVAIGGTGSGRNDTSVTRLARLGRVVVHGIALSPGETAAFGIVADRPVLLLPGRLDAAVAVWLALGRRLLARLAAADEEMSAATAVLGRKIASPLGLTEIVPVRTSSGKAEPLASGYWPLAAMAQADGWVLVPADSEGYPAGAQVVVRPWP